MKGFYKYIKHDIKNTELSSAGLGKVTIAELEPAVSFCDVLIYGWVGIDPATNKAKALNSKIDLDEGQGLFRQVTGLKNRYPKLKVISNAFTKNVLLLSFFTKH